MRLDELLRRRGSSAEPALDGLTWRDWDREADRAALSLEAAGLRPGGRVVLALPRSPDLMVWMLGCWRAGGVAVPLDPESPPAEAALLEAHADPQVRVVPEGPRFVGDSSLSPDGDALILYTSGSTGTPKGVRHTHSSLLASMEGLCEAFGLDERTRVLGTLTLTASHGLFVQALPVLVHGGSLLLGPPLSAFTAASVWEMVQRVTFLTMVPAQVPLLVEAARGDLPSFLVAGCASAPLRPEVAARFQERFGRPLLNSFGMTETAGWCLYGSPSAPSGSVGRPGSCEVRFVDGEMRLRGPQVTPGYWRSEERALDSDGWLCTGDLGLADPLGWVRLTGRRKRTIQHLGRSVQPEEVEAVLASMDEVLEAAVVGVEHPVYGEAPVAWLVLRKPLDPLELRRRLRERLAPWKVPRWFRELPSLPRTRTGKPDLAALARLPL